MLHPNKQPVILEVRNLSVEFRPDKNTRLKAVENVSFSLHEGELLGLVGESGCGKTTMMLSMLRLLPEAGRITSGKILYRNQDLLDLEENQMRDFRWKEIAIIFQGAMNALNPVRTVHDQIAEAITCHEIKTSKEKTDARVSELLEMVGIPASRGTQYPFQFSGGMRQRVMIAMALACSPSIVIADEPTTALDVMIQAQILELLQELSQRRGLAVILVTHDLGVVAEICDHVLVMYAGVTAE
jgi:peptide/nickel transport system ATP-binding protein